MLAVALGGAGSALFVALSFSLVARVARSPSREGGELARRVARAPAADRPRLALETSQPGSWERRLAEAAVCVDVVERRDRLSEVVDELAIELGKSAHWGPALLRLQLLVGGFAVIVALFGRHVFSSVMAGVCAAAGGLIVAANKRRGEVVERRQRELADRLVSLVDPDHPTTGSERASRRRP